jgi:hypothetical protein
MSQLFQVIKSLNPTQRLGAFVFIALLTSFTAILTVYLKSDECSSLAEENVRMHEDFAKISKLLRELRMEKDDIPAESPLVDSLMVDTSKPLKTETINYSEILDKIEIITKSNK